ncbi:SEC-C metal-binding domain-containing protein [Aquipseudomonas alcaligenes]|uniref:SEC-C metal-binding domain-containing protein n=1 Tax=Aquipseudomonas alcaligenes TaxID=43263 RepID=UPI0036653E27
MELACILKPDQSRSRAPTPTLFSQPLLAPGRKAKRYDPCPCESGKKFKKCHGA